ncbi:MAG: Dyp-type peroxidase [Solirubrobacteraceae bacterium]
MTPRHDMQGNILRGYASHRHAAYLLTRVGDPAQARAFMRRLLKDDQIATERSWRARPVMRLNVAFTHPGLKRLHPNVDAFAPFTDFRQGMRERARSQLGDVGANDPHQWESRLREEIDALFTVYGDTVGARDDAARDLTRELRAATFTLVHDQRADMLEGDREHFGFTDGFSQPALPGVSEDRRSRRGEGAQRRRWRRLLGDEWRDIRLGEFVLGHRDEDGVVPGGREPLLYNGTFMVWRKLEQDVKLFRQWIQMQAGDAEEAQIRLQARILGRWPDGVSLVRRPPFDASYRATGSPSAIHNPDINDFTYRADRLGLRCPLGAHVRRCNPRDALGFRTERARRNRIIRRGMPYVDAGHAPSRGLIFVCFNASITRQFEQIQGHWLMGGDSFGLGSDRDFLTAGVDAEQPAVKMTLQGTRDRPPQFLTRDRQFVTVRGGHYLFVPGLSALRQIVGG